MFIVRIYERGGHCIVSAQFVLIIVLTRHRAKSALLITHTGRLDEIASLSIIRVYLCSSFSIHVLPPPTRLQLRAKRRKPAIYHLRNRVYQPMSKRRPRPMARQGQSKALKNTDRTLRAVQNTHSFDIYRSFEGALDPGVFRIIWDTFIRSQRSLTYSSCPIRSCSAVFSAHDTISPDIETRGEKGQVVTPWSCGLVIENSK